MSSSWTGRLYYCPPACLQALAQLAGTVMWRDRISSTPTCKEGARRKAEAGGGAPWKRLGKLIVRKRRKSSSVREEDRDRKERERGSQDRKSEIRDRKRKRSKRVGLSVKRRRRKWKRKRRNRRDGLRRAPGGIGS